MSTDNALVLAPRNLGRFTPEAGEAVARLFALGHSLREIWQSSPDQYPEPMFVTRWRREYPAFDALMREAEAARAVDLAEAAIKMADDPGVSPARARVAVSARQWYAEKLDPKRMGARTTLAGDLESPVAVMNGDLTQVDEATLLAIIAGRLPAPNPAAGGGEPPLCASTPPRPSELPGPALSHKIGAGPSVSSNTSGGPKISESDVLDAVAQQMESDSLD
jgi:hypothetical protein